MSKDLVSLHNERSRLYRELSQIGDFRRGSISVNYRRCGKPNCACVKPKHPGHGPQYLLTSKVHGKSQAKNIRPGAELHKVEQEVANHKHFRELVARIIEVSERICELRPPQAASDDEVKKTLPARSRRKSARKSIDS